MTSGGEQRRKFQEMVVTGSFSAFSFRAVLRSSVTLPERTFGSRGSNFWFSTLPRSPLTVVLFLSLSSQGLLFSGWQKPLRVVCDSSVCSPGTSGNEKEKL